MIHLYKFLYYVGFSYFQKIKYVGRFEKAAKLFREGLYFKNSCWVCCQYFILFRNAFLAILEQGANQETTQGMADFRTFVPTSADYWSAVHS